MKARLPKYLPGTSAMLKKQLLLIVLSFCSFNLDAQAQNIMTVGIEAGVLDLAESGSLGLFIYVEPKIKSSENTVIGLRIGATLNSQTIENADSLKFNIDDHSDNGTISLVPTFDYFWNERKLRPSLGVGVGYHLFGNPIEAYRIGGPDPSEGILEIEMSKRVGLLLRGGLELGKMRLGLEYNFIPKSDIKLPEGPTIGTVDISYLGLSIGFEFGSGKNS